MKKLRVTVENKIYEVLVEVLDEPTSPASNHHSAAAPLPVAAQPQTLATPVAARASSTPSSAPAAEPTANAVASPLAGKVVSVDVKVGQTISRDTQVLTIEAMKMNTYVYSARAGTVKAILVTAGDGVDQGQALVQLE